MKDLLFIAAILSLTVSANAFWWRRCPIEGQVYTRCAQTVCPATCENPIETCRVACRPGCACPRGYLLDNLKRKCVRFNQCPTLVCPPLRPGQIGTCVERCSSDDDCTEGEKCCSNGCGHVCTTAVPLDCSAASCLACAPGAVVIPPPPDSCCGSCHCSYSGEVYKPGDTFPADDGCNTCTCGLDGHVACTEIACPTTSICSLEPDSGPCEAYIPRYFYNTTSEQCEQFIYGGCRGNTNNFISLKKCQNACQSTSCKLPNGKVLQDGETDNSNPCSPCTCINGKLICLSILCLLPDCGDNEPFVPSGKCCPVCPVCTYNGQSYLEGDSFPAGDGCNRCTCRSNGLVTCTRIACPPKPLVCPPVRPGQGGICAELCSSDDNCTEGEKCCSNGCGHVCTTAVPLDCSAVLCAACPKGATTLPPRPNECCNRCGCTYNGVLYETGESFPADDGCNTCSCTSDGRVLCTLRACIEPIE